MSRKDVESSEPFVAIRIDPGCCTMNILPLPSFGNCKSTGLLSPLMTGFRVNVGGGPPDGAGAAECPLQPGRKQRNSTIPGTRTTRSPNMAEILVHPEAFPADALVHYRLLKANSPIICGL